MEDKLSMLFFFQVAELYNNQEQIKNQHGGNKVTEEDFY